MFDADELIQHQRVLIAYASKVTGNLELAKDLVQTTYMRALQYRDTYTGTNLAAWLQTILKNAIATHYLAKSRRPDIADISLDEVEYYAPLSSLDKYYYGNYFMDDELESAYLKLKFPYRQIIYLSYVEDEDDIKISKKLGIERGTCRTRRKKAIDDLKEMML